MAFTLASSGGAASGSLTGVTAAQGTLIAITAFGVATGNVAVSLSSVTDNTAGGNTYLSIPAVASSAFFATPNQTSAQVTVWCLVQNALSANTITVSFSGASITIASYTVWSGVPPGTTVLNTALTAGILLHESSQALPSLFAPAGALAIANVNLNGAVSSFSGGFTVVAPEANMGYLVTGAAGSVATTATFAGASDTWAVSDVIFGPPSASGAVSYAPGWHPGSSLPGMPGGTPFLAWPPPWTAPAATAAAIALAEAASGADALAITASATLAESGASAEALSVAAAVALTEAGSASDALAVTAGAALAEAGSASDALAVGAAAALADAASAADALSVGSAVALAESGAGADSLLAGVATPLADAGHSAEALTLAIAPFLAEAGSAADVLAVAAAVAFADSGLGADALTAGAVVVFSPGTLTAVTAPGATLTASAAAGGVLTAGTASSGLTAATAAQGGLTAGTQSTGGPS